MRRARARGRARARRSASCWCGRPSGGPRSRPRGVSSRRPRRAAIGPGRAARRFVGQRGRPHERHPRPAAAPGRDSARVATASVAGRRSARRSPIALRGRISPPCSTQRPHAVTAPTSRAWSSSASSNRDLPIPASPEMRIEPRALAGLGARSDHAPQRGPPLSSSSTRPTRRPLETRLDVLDHRAPMPHLHRGGVRRSRTGAVPHEGVRLRSRPPRVLRLPGPRRLAGRARAGRTGQLPHRRRRRGGPAPSDPAPVRDRDPGGRHERARHPGRRPRRAQRIRWRPGPLRHRRRCLMGRHRGPGGTVTEAIGRLRHRHQPTNVTVEVA